MLDGLPLVFDYIVRMVARKRPPGSLAVVLYYLLGDTANALELALNHYFPLTLGEPFLQNSTHGTPYQKWAKFTNEDFQKVNECIRRLMSAVWKCYHDADERSSTELPLTIKDAWHWFHMVGGTYACCVVNTEEPTLKLSAIHLEGYVDPRRGRFLKVPSWSQLMLDQSEPRPPITKENLNIADRATVRHLHRTGLARLQELRARNSELATWLRSNCTIEEITGAHQGRLLDADMD